MSVTQSVQVGGREEVFVKLASMYSDNRKRERERERVSSSNICGVSKHARAHSLAKYTARTYRMKCPSTLPFV